MHRRMAPKINMSPPIKDRAADLRQRILVCYINRGKSGWSACMGIFALGIMPYISASIIVQLLGAMWEPLKQLKKEGEQGRKKLNQYTRYGIITQKFCIDNSVNNLIKKWIE